MKPEHFKLQNLWLLWFLSTWFDECFLATGVGQHRATLIADVGYLCRCAATKVCSSLLLLLEFCVLYGHIVFGRAKTHSTVSVLRILSPNPHI